MEAHTLSFWDKVFKGELEHNRFAIISVILIIANEVNKSLLPL